MKNKEGNDPLSGSKPLSGYVPPNFALELLSSTDFIIQTQGSNALEVVKNQLENWNPRKKTLFSNDRFIQIAIEHLNTAGLA